MIARRPSGSAMRPEDAEKLLRSTLSTRGMCLWGAAAIVVPVAALAVALAAVPVMETRSAVRDYSEGRLSVYAALDRLGSRQQAAERLSSYLSLPTWAAAGREKAAGLLAECGQPAAEPLQRALTDPSPDVRAAAAEGLKKLRSPS
jgi:hypothetical protein